MDQASVVAYDVADRGQSQARTLARGLRGKELLKNMPLGLRIHAPAVVAHNEESAGQLYRARSFDFAYAHNLQPAITRFHRDPPTFWHRVPGVQHQIQKNLASLRGIHPHYPQIRIKLVHELNVLADQPQQQLPHFLGDLVQREQVRRFVGHTRHCQQLPHQPRSMYCRGADFLRIPPQTLVRFTLVRSKIAKRTIISSVPPGPCFEPRHEQIAVQGHSGQQIVEIMSHAAGQPPQRFQSLSLAWPPSGGVACRGIFCHRQTTE
jgi:hypothetical protein